MPKKYRLTSSNPRLKGRLGPQRTAHNPRLKGRLAHRRNPGENLVVLSRIKAEIAAQGMRKSKEFDMAISDMVRRAVSIAMRRAQENKRMTLKPADLPMF